MARGVTLTVLTPQPPRSGWKSRHCAYQRLANSNHIGLPKEAPEPFPVLFVAQGINVRSDCLVHVHSQRSVKLLSYPRHIR